MGILPPVGKMRIKGNSLSALVGRWTLLSKGVQKTQKAEDYFRGVLCNMLKLGVISGL